MCDGKTGIIQTCNRPHVSPTQCIQKAVGNETRASHCGYDILILKRRCASFSNRSDDASTLVLNEHTIPDRTIRNEIQPGMLNRVLKDRLCRSAQVLKTVSSSKSSTLGLHTNFKFDVRHPCLLLDAATQIEYAVLLCCKAMGSGKTSNS